ncbi:hypothetical protein [Pseudomonas aeruginosa]|uniref:hypothetical protein n=1 Tax=Pseudomonas aeruginosa TaxID=287 RepID=UPI001CD2BFEB|nr:hypothetical protein [Pseudomonas aeruginosa]
MNDRELLELAARAAGIKARWFKVNQWRQDDVFGTHHRKPWNPLNEDGDALRLAHRLGLAVDMSACVINFAIPDQDDSEMEIEVALEYEPFDGDIAHTRRAIVRAAAEIGKSMGGGE